MEYTKELLQDLFKKAREIGEIQGYTVNRYDYNYLEMDGEYLNLVLLNIYSDSNDRYEVLITPEDLNKDNSVLLAEKKAREEEARLFQIEQRRLQDEERIKRLEEQDKKEYKRLKKKYESK